MSVIFLTLPSVLMLKVLVVTFSHFHSDFILLSVIAQRIVELIVIMLNIIVLNVFILCVVKLYVRCCCAACRCAVYCYADCLYTEYSYALFYAIMLHVVKLFANYFWTECCKKLKINMNIKNISPL